MSAVEGDGLPWYRHFWPWFIVGLLGTAVAASVATAVVAIRGGDSLVGDDYYRDGLAINRRLVGLEAASRLGVSARLTVGGADEVVVELRSGEATPPAALDLELRHATRSRQDQRIRLTASAEGPYRGAASELRSGRYYATLTPVETDPENEWRLSRALFARGRTTVQLGGGAR